MRTIPRARASETASLCSRRAFHQGERTARKRNLGLLHIGEQWRISANLLCETVMQSRRLYFFTKEATLTGFEPTLNFSRLCAIPSQTCARLHVRGESANQSICTIRAELRSSSVRNCPKTIGRFYGACFGKPSQRARGFGKDVVRDKNIVVGVMAVPAGAAQKVADDLVDAGVRIIFNYSEGLLDVPSDVTVHTSNPAVELLHALDFHLA